MEERSRLDEVKDEVRDEMNRVEMNRVEVKRDEVIGVEVR